jgi:hypothetical protein
MIQPMLLALFLTNPAILSRETYVTRLRPAQFQRKRIENGGRPLPQYTQHEVLAFLDRP